MTVISWVLAIAAIVVCIPAARRIAPAKGRDKGRWVTAVIFGGPVALLVLMVLSPKGEMSEADPLAWWSSNPVARTWGALALLFSVPAIVVAVVVGVHQGTEGYVDGHALEASLEFDVAAQLHQETGDIINLHVTCPASPPMRKGYIFDCDVSGWPDNAASHIRITEDDGSGHYHWEPY